MDNTMFHTYPVTPVDGKEGGGLRKRRTRRGSDGVSRASKGRAATIIRASDVLDNTKQTPFFRWTIAWILLVSLIGSCFLMHFEGGKGGEDGGLGWVDAIFLSAGGVTATGLNSFDITTFSRSSLTTLMVVTQLGSATFMSLVPVLIRLRSLRQVIPKNYRTFNLNKFKRVPEWLVEYKSLIYLVRIVVLTNVVVYFLYGGILYTIVVNNEDAKRILNLPATASGSSPAYWTIFHVISAYNNCGYALMPNSFEDFANVPSVYFCLNMLILHGNVMYPIVLRWSIIFMSAITPKSWSRKVYFRYLLLNGRHLHSNLFGSQQTWLLLIQQLMLISIQVIFECFGTVRKPSLSVAIFESINVRHAGFNSIPLSQIYSGLLIMFISFMYLAPMPYIAMLRSSMVMAPNERTGASIGESFIGAISSSFLGGSEDSTTLLNGLGGGDGGDGTASVATPVTVVTQQTQNSRKLSLNMARDNARSSALWTEKATMRSELSSVTRKSIRNVDRVTPELLDTRLLILTMYGDDEHVPWKQRVTLRVNAVSFQAKKLWGRFQGGIKPDMFLIWFFWWAICTVESFESTSPAIFNTLFEIVSSFGNVGLSMGSIKDVDSPCTFAMDLSWVSKFMLIFVQIAGRTRDLPSKVDSVLTVTKPVGADEVLTEAWLGKDDDEEDVEEGLQGGEGEGLLGVEGGEELGTLIIDEGNPLEDGVGVGAGGRGGGGGNTTPLLRDFNGISNRTVAGGQGGSERRSSKRDSRVTFSEI
ncbi:hypothetical protein TrVE_jg508 [Triparma verrucosa]|uniref:Uncharacterized protein n=1 Tax=Triparma verrucosa TaxID=1606542 RepID=A0A9W7EWW5_9STRA|nr:hypothetical protein TrVE_jg508 [Triparma verrucosa]